MPPRPPTPREHLQASIDFAFVEFGMLEDEFLSQTPKQWQRRMDAWLNRERRTDRRFARVCAVIANVWGANTTEEDFMPKDPRISLEDEAMTIDEMFVALGGDLPNG